MSASAEPTEQKSSKVDFLSGVDLHVLNNELKRNFVDCYRQDYGKEELPSALKLMVLKVAGEILPGRMIPAGSRIEGTMTPTFFGRDCTFQADSDFMYELDLSSVNATLIPVMTEHPGFVRLVLTSSLLDIHSIFEASVLKDELMALISPKRFKEEWMNRIRERVLKTDSFCRERPESIMFWDVSTKIVGPSVRLVCDPLTADAVSPEIITLHLTNDKEFDELTDLPKEIRVSEIDFVPALGFDSWPEEAASWITRERVWPDKSLLDKVAQAGYHIVPKSSSDQMNDIEWRVSFSYAEGVLLKSIPNFSWCKQCYRIFKCLIKYHLSHPNVISTYHCKTIFLWSLERYHPDTWIQGNLGERFFGLIDTMIHALLQKWLSQYFISSENLFYRIETDFALFVAQKLSNLRKKPFDYIYRLEVVPWDDEFQDLTIEEMLSYDGASMVNMDGEDERTKKSTAP